MPISVFFETQCPKIMVLSKALQAKLLSIPNEVASLSTLGQRAIGKNCCRVFVQPPSVAMLPRAWGPLGAPLDDDVVCTELRVLSLSRWRKVFIYLWRCGRNLGQILGDYQR